MTCRRALYGTAAVGLAVLCMGCSTGARTARPPTATSSSQVVDTSVASVVVENLQKDGRVVLHPVDTTTADCPAAHCAQAITTDRFQIMSFTTTGAAQRFAAEHRSRQIESLVVTFSPNVPEQERDELWSRITGMVG